MALILFSKDEVIDYIPEYGGNRESTDPFAVRLKFVPYSRIQQYSAMLAARGKTAADEKKILEVQRAVQRQQFTDNVVSVSGVSTGGKEITDPGEFYDMADAELVFEILRAMESTAKLTEGQRKN